MKKKFKVLAFLLFFVFTAGMTSVFSKELYKQNHDSGNLKITFDSKKKGEMPKRFRKSSDKIETEGKMPNLTGLKELKESGSAQFTPGNIGMVKKAIESDKIAVVDLRQESHGFINDFAVSWKNDEGNKANKGLTRKQVIKEEKKRLKSVKKGKSIKIKDKTVVPKKVQSEEELVRENGMEYIRIPVTDTERPEDDMVDYFVKTVTELPEDTWLHFHCKAGIGRTTTFMAMYDMMKNAKQVSLEDIMDRQVLMGGKSLLKPEDGKDSSSHKRSDFLRKFYKYARENDDNFKTSWSTWLKTN